MILTLMTLRLILVNIGVCCVLAACGVGSILQQRFELTSPTDGVLSMRDAAFMASHGMSPYSGMGFHMPPLVFAACNWLINVALFLGLPPALTHVLPALAAESVAALLLHRLALNQHHTQPHTAPAPHTLVAIFLFNPWQLCAVVGGAAGGQLVSAAVLAVLVCAQQCCTTRAAMATGATMALALYVFPYSVTLLPSVVLLQTHVDKDSIQPVDHDQKHVDHDQKHDDQQESIDQQHYIDQQQHIDQHCKAAPALPPATVAHALRSTWQHRRRVVGMVGGVVLTATVLVVLSDVCMLPYPAHQCQGVLWLVRHLLEVHGDEYARVCNTSSITHIHDVPWWPVAVYGVYWQAPSLQPSLGPHWYLFTQVFEKDAPFFRVALHLLSGAFALPLALRLPGQPLLAAALQLGVVTMCMTHPTVVDITRVLALYSLHTPLLSSLPTPTLLLLTTTALLLSALVPTMHHAWVMTGSANANYLYSMTTAVGAWQGVVVVLLLRAALHVQTREGQGGGMSGKQGETGGGTTSACKQDT